MIDTTKSADLNAMFASKANEDMSRFTVPESVNRWLFADRLAARNTRQEMSFAEYIGHDHIRKFFLWHRRAHFPDYFGSTEFDNCVMASTAADEKMCSALDIHIPYEVLERIARYNAQDWTMLHAYPVPSRQRARVLLDFGAGHGRLANPAFNSPNKDGRLSTYIAVEGIPSTYFTQLAYLRGLGLKVWEYLEQDTPAVTQDSVRYAIEEYDVIHLPTWCLPLVPNDSVDMVSCVQVLKELPGTLVPWVVEQFSRVNKVQGAVYIRDHIQFHNPNHMPIDAILQSRGYALEFAPQIRDRHDLHGMPRIWRCFDVTQYIREE